MLLINFIKKALALAVKKQLSNAFLISTISRIITFVFIFLMPWRFSYCQNLDSLYQVAQTLKNDSIKLRQFNKIAFSYIFSNAERASEIIKEGKQEAENKNLYYNIAELTNTYGIYMDVTGKSDSAQYYFSRALDISRAHKIPSIESMCLNNLGMYNWNRGNYKEAQDYFFQALKMNESKGDRKSTASALNNIGLIYQEMNMANEALKYHKKSFEIRKEFDLKKEQASSLNNIGICLKDLGKNQEAKEAYQKGLDIAKASDNLTDYYKILENLGTLYENEENYAKAAYYYNLCLNSPEDMSDKNKEDIVVLGKLTGVYNKLDQPAKAMEYATKGEEKLNTFKHYSFYADDLLINAAETHYRMGNNKKARKFIEEFVKLTDSSFSKENAKAIADLEVKYDTEKKERLILEQRANLAEKELLIQKQHYQLYGSFVLALVLGLIGYLFYSQQKLKNKQLQKENELKDALLKIETQNKLQEQRLRISRDLHDNIGSQLTFIISSLDNLQYGFKIENDELRTKLQSISEFTSSTITDLRDTIWAMNKSEISFDDLQSRISNFIDKANLAAHHISFTLNIEAALKGKTFTSVVGMNIYRIIQEAVNNSIKYSETDTIDVKIEDYEGRIGISIVDNGKGFDSNSLELGNGLNNMKKRAQDIDAKLTIDARENQGTKISLIV